jgi:hypothetical protein
VRKIAPYLWTLLIIVLFSLIALSGLGPAPVKAQAPRVEDDGDADLPPLLRGRIEKEEYLALRDAHVNGLRGVPYERFDARTKAIQEMELQERENAAPNISSLMWTSIGPSPIPNRQTSPQTPVNGQVTSIAVDQLLQQGLRGHRARQRVQINRWRHYMEGDI